MAKAKQLPSGSWRVLAYAGKDESGKRVYKSFTESTERKANLAALEWQEHYKEIASDSANMTLNEAIQAYVELKSNILSPATIRGYESIRKNKLKNIMNLKLCKITNQMIQAEINNESAVSSPKTVRNIYGLLRTILAQYRPDFRVSVTLPQPKKYEGKSLNGEQIARLLDVIQGDEAEIPILLALWLGLRRSEIIGLKWDNIDFIEHTLTITSAMVPDKDNNFVLKGPKTASSERTLKLPDYVYDKLKAADKSSEFVATLAGDTIRKRLQRFCRKAGIPEVRLHDLRHTMASIGLMLNISDKYMMERGGWSYEGTMKKIYQHTMKEGEDAANNLINGYFKSLIKR